MKKNIKKIESDIPKNIIRILQKHKTMRFTELKDLIGISAPSMSFHLELLLQNQEITVTKKGREKHYSLSEKRNKHLTQIELFGDNHHSKILSEMMMPSEEYDLYEYVERTLSSFLIFTLLQSIKTGENWYKEFQIDHMTRVILDRFAFSIFDGFRDGRYDEAAYYLAKLNFNKFFSTMKDMIDDKKSNDELEGWFNALKERYPDEFQKLKKSMEDIT